MKKIFNQESFNYFLEHLFVVELTYRYIFSFKFTLRYQQFDIVPIFCTVVVDTGGVSSLLVCLRSFNEELSVVTPVFIIYSYPFPLVG